MKIEDFLDQRLPELRRVALGLAGGNHDLGDEVLQRGLIRCWEKWSELEHSGAHKWATRVMYFECLMMRRQMARSPTLTFIDSSSFIDRIEAAMHARALLESVRKYVHTKKDSLTLQGFTRNEVANIVGTAPFEGVRDTQILRKQVRGAILKLDAAPLEW